MKNIRHLAELNYKKAAALFMLLDNPIDILKVQLDQAVLIEDQLQGGQQKGFSCQFWASFCNVFICERRIKFFIQLWYSMHSFICNST